MTPATWARTSTRRDAAACPTNSKRAETVSGAIVSTVTWGGGGMAGTACRHAQPPWSTTTAALAQTAIGRQRLRRTTASGVIELVLWKYGPAARAARALPGFLSGWSASRFRGLASGRSAARLARLVRDQEVGGSNPLAPTENQMLDGLRVSSISFRELPVDSLP